MYNDRKPDYASVKNKALHFLEYRIHSEHELCEKLKRAGAGSEDIEKVIEFLREYKLVDDREFARRYAGDLKNIKKLGKKRVKTELINKGIASEIIRETIDEFEWDSEETLYPLVRKKLSGNFERKNIDKCIRYFAYRGYGYEEIKNAIERIQAEEEYGI